MNRADKNREHTQKGRRLSDTQLFRIGFVYFVKRYLYFDANLILHKYELLRFITFCVRWRLLLSCQCITCEWLNVGRFLYILCRIGTCRHTLTPSNRCINQKPKIFTETEQVLPGFGMELKHCRRHGLRFGRKHLKKKINFNSLVQFVATVCRMKKRCEKVIIINMAIDV